MGDMESHNYKIRLNYKDATGKKRDEFILISMERIIVVYNNLCINLSPIYKYIFNLRLA